MAAQTAEKRGPKLGDAVSLWNFTPAPGWTKEQVQLLRLCLMRYGVGQWVQIMETGLLPGKMVQQLNGQTQRLLGQQSLAAYTNLQVDVDRIRADNEARTDVMRKAGLVIWSGPNPTKEMKAQWQEEALQMYGLTAEQIEGLDEQIEEARLVCIAADAAAAATSGRIATTSSEAAVSLRDSTAHLPDWSADALTAEEQRCQDMDASALSRVQKVALLHSLRSTLSRLAQQLDRWQVHTEKQGLLEEDEFDEDDIGVTDMDMDDDFKEDQAASLNEAGASTAEQDVAGGTALARGAAVLCLALGPHGPSRRRRQRTIGAKATTAQLPPNRAARRKRSASGKAGRTGKRAAWGSDSGSGFEEDDDEGFASASGSDSAALDARHGDTTRRGDAGPGAGGARRRRSGKGAALAASAAARRADVDHLAAMGFGTAKAKEALEETGGDMEAAVEWLFTACA